MPRPAATRRVARGSGSGLHRCFLWSLGACAALWLASLLPAALWQGSWQALDVACVHGWTGFLATMANGGNTTTWIIPTGCGLFGACLLAKSAVPVAYWNAGNGSRLFIAGAGLVMIGSLWGSGALALRSGQSDRMLDAANQAAAADIASGLRAMVPSVSDRLAWQAGKTADGTPTLGLDGLTLQACRYELGHPPIPGLPVPEVNGRRGGACGWLGGNRVTFTIPQGVSETWRYFGN